MAASLAGLARYLPHNRFHDVSSANRCSEHLVLHPQSPQQVVQGRQSTEPDTQILQDSPRKKPAVGNTVADEVNDG